MWWYNKGFFENKPNENAIYLTQEEFDTLMEHIGNGCELIEDESGRPTFKETTYSKINTIENRILILKRELEKYKEDVEQVELFGMERADYEEKKTKCAEIILELRVLEKQLKELG